MNLSTMIITERDEKLIKAFNSVERFNSVINNPHSYQAVLNQLLRVHEELNEAFVAIAKVSCRPSELGREWVLKPENAIDKKMLLDGVEDILVTAFGLVAKMEALGYDVLGGLQAVTDNNEEKYHESEEAADITVEMYTSQGIDVYKEYNSEYGVWVVKDKAENKLRKPYNFVGVELSSYLPKGEQCEE